MPMDNASTFREHHLDFLSPHGFSRMHYYEWGEPDNPDVVMCVHGLTRNGRDFDALAQALCGRFRVLCPDVPGRGKSGGAGHAAHDATFRIC